MKIAIATVRLRGRSGTEIVTIELARELKRRGHDIFVFTAETGHTASLLAQDGIPAIDDLNLAPFEPEIVHGNHNVVLVQALLHFREAPGVYVCHDAQLWQNRPPDMTRIRKYVAVDQHCLERVERELPRVAGQTVKLHNAVDLRAYRPRSPLPSDPQRALILTKNRKHVGVIEHVCRRRGLTVDSAGPGVANTLDDLPARLAAYDVVFATARMAIEAMAVGCAVIVCDERGFAGLVTPDNVEPWRDRNFGASILRSDVSTESIDQALDAYDAKRCSDVSQYIRAHNSLERAASLYEEVYRAAIAESSTGAVDERREVSALLRDWLPGLDGYAPIAKDIVVNSNDHNLPREQESLFTELHSLRASHEEQWLQLKEAYSGTDYLAGIDIVSCGITQIAGSVFLCEVMLTNKGEATWFAMEFADSSHPICMSYHWLDASGSTVVFDGLRTPLTERVRPGDRVSCAMRIEAPPRAGAYTLVLDVIHEQVRWFKSERALQIDIVV
jgi:hypothetical protein